MKKRDFRTLWIQRINAGSRIYGLHYNFLIHGLTLAKVNLNRKMLADIAVTEPLSFKSVVELAKQHLAKREDVQAAIRATKKTLPSTPLSIAATTKA